MALLDLLRRFRPDEEDEDQEQVEGAGEESDDEDADDDAGGGLLARLARTPGLGRLLSRGADDGDDDEDEAGDEEADEGEDEDGAGGGFFGRFTHFNLLNRLRGVGRDDEDDDEEDEPLLPSAGAALVPEPPDAELEASPTAGEADSTAADNQLPLPGGAEELPPGAAGPTPEAGLADDDDEEEEEEEEEAAPGEEDPDRLPDAAAPGLPTVAWRLRELARSQEDVPAEELAGELRDLLSSFERRR